MNILSKDLQELMKKTLITLSLLALSLQFAFAQFPLYGDSLRSLRKVVTLTPYLPDSAAAPAPAIIVFPGGSYCWLDKETEGHMVARWLQSQGIAAFVLTYRVVTPAKFATGIRLLTGERIYPKMLNDAEAAILYVRQHAREYNINAGQVGTIGFSAGGHLSLMLAEWHSADSLRPDFTAAVYPVVTFTDRKHAHRRTRRAAIGIYYQFNRKRQAELSLEQHVPADMPPVFLLACKDDRTVDYENTLMMDSALTAMQIPHSTTVYNFGDHGFGANPQKFTPETAQWQQTFIQWLETVGMKSE